MNYYVNECNTRNLYLLSFDLKIKQLIHGLGLLNMEPNFSLLLAIRYLLGGFTIYQHYLENGRNH